MQHCIQNCKEFNILFLASGTGISFLIHCTADHENKREKNNGRKLLTEMHCRQNKIVPVLLEKAACTSV